MHRTTIAWLALGSAVILAGCERTPQVPGQQTMATGDVQNAALATYVKPGDLDDYYLFHSARADLLRRLGRTDDAVLAYRRALGLATNESVRAFLDRRIAELTA